MGLKLKTLLKSVDDLMPELPPSSHYEVSLLQISLFMYTKFYYTYNIAVRVNLPRGNCWCIENEQFT